MLLVAQAEADNGRGSVCLPRELRRSSRTLVARDARPTRRPARRVANPTVWDVFSFESVRRNVRRTVQGGRALQFQVRLVSHVEDFLVLRPELAVYF